MNPEASLYRPIPTCEIPPPIVEVDAGEFEGRVPRILLEGVGEGRARGHVLALAALFLLLAAAELALLVRMPVPEPIVVYGDIPRTLLMEARK